MGEKAIVDLLAGPPKYSQVNPELHLVPEQEDVLQEMGHIGAGRASGELSKLTGSIVRVAQPRIEFFTMDEHAKQFIERDSGEVVVVFTHIGGDARGDIMTILYDNSPTVLVDIIKEQSVGKTKDLSDDDDKRRIISICSDLCNKYVNSVSQLLSLKLEKEEYRLVAAHPQAFSTYLAMSMLAGKENAIFLKVSTDFSTEHTNKDTGEIKPITGDFIFLLELDSVIGMLKVVKEKLESISI